jgi:hypothetical protein
LYYTCPLVLAVFAGQGSLYSLEQDSYQISGVFLTLIAYKKLLCFVIFELLNCDQIFNKLEMQEQISIIFISFDRNK